MRDEPFLLGFRPIWFRGCILVLGEDYHETTRHTQKQKEKKSNVTVCGFKQRVMDDGDVGKLNRTTENNSPPRSFTRKFRPWGKTPQQKNCCIGIGMITISYEISGSLWNWTIQDSMVHVSQGFCWRCSLGFNTTWWAFPKWICWGLICCDVPGLFSSIHGHPKQFAKLYWLYHAE